jgi:hypothetical protein
MPTEQCPEQPEPPARNGAGPSTPAPPRDAERPPDADATPALGPTGLRRRAGTLLRKWPRALLLLGIVLCAWPLLRAVPRTHPVRLRLDRPDEVTRVALVWSEPDGNRPLRHGEWGFAPGRAPRELTTELSASPGRYRAEVRVERGPLATTSQQTVVLEPDEAEVVLTTP